MKAHEIYNIKSTVAITADCAMVITNLVIISVMHIQTNDNFDIYVFGCLICYV